jgi:hypothetical protein
VAAPLEQAKISEYGKIKQQPQNSTYTPSAG